MKNGRKKEYGKFEGLRDAVALSHKTSKFAIAALRLCSLRCFVPLQTFLPEQRQKMLSGPLGSSPVSATKKTPLRAFGGGEYRKLTDYKITY